MRPSSIKYQVSNTKFILILISLLICTKAIISDGAEFKSNNRVQIGLEYDDNIREDPDKSARGSLYSLYLRSANNIVLKNRIQFDLKYQGGYKKYIQNLVRVDDFNPQKPVLESRLINNIDSNIGLKFFDGLFGGIGNNIEVKQVKNTTGEHQYLITNNEIFAEKEISNNIYIKFYSAVKYLNYEELDLFDYREFANGLAIKKRFSSNLKSEWDFSRQDRRFARGAQRGIEILSRSQEDILYQSVLKVELYKFILVRTIYIFQRNTSNSDGYAFLNHRGVILLSKDINNKTFIQSYLAIQNKTYFNVLDELIPGYVGAETEDQNSIVIKLSRDLMNLSKDGSKQLTLEVKYSRYYNLSDIPNRYYLRNIYSMSLNSNF